MLGRKSIYKIDCSFERGCDQNCSVARCRLVGRIFSPQLLKLHTNLTLHISCRFRRGCQKKTCSIRGMFGLRQQIRRDPSGVPACREDHRLRRSGGQVNRAIGADQLLRSSHKTIARPKDFVDVRNTGCAIRERCDGLSAADARDLGDAEHRCRCQQFVIRSRAYDHDSLHACHLRRDNGHQKCRDQRVSAAGDVAANRLDWTHHLRDRDARLDLERGTSRQLRLRDAANISRGVPNGSEEILPHATARRLDFTPRDPHVLSA